MARILVLLTKTVCLLAIPASCMPMSRQTSNGYNMIDKLQTVGNIAKVYDSKMVNDSFFVCDIGIDSVKAALINAKTTAKNLIWKGSFLLKLDNGMQLHVSYYGNFFKIDDNKTYLITDEYKTAFSMFTSNIIQNEIIPRRSRPEARQHK